jgi:P4 family phage/plasmid primase-like protien
MSAAKTPLDIALDYIGRGWRPIPVKHATKEFNGTGALDSCHIDAANADQYFNGKSQNIAVLLGTASGGLVDVDLDDPVALRLADVILPPTDSVFGRSGSPSSHRLYQIDGDSGKRETFSDNGMLVEYRADHYTVFPGSTHTSGEAIEWVTDGHPAKIERRLLLGRIGVLAAATAIAKRWGEGHRDNLSAATSGILLRLQMPRANVESIIGAVCDAVGESAKERRKHVNKVKRFAELIAKSPTDNTVPSFGNLLECTKDDKFVAVFKKWLNFDDSDAIIGPSDDDLALDFADEHENDLRYVAKWGRWLIYDGTRWAEDETLATFDLARALCRDTRDQLLPTLKPAQQKALRQRLGAAATIYNVVKLAGNDRRLAISHKQLDADPWALNTPGGVFDLRTGVMRAHDPKELHTKITSASPGGTCPKWLDTLRTVLPKASVRAYLQRLLGYGLTGSSRDHVVPFFYGPGRNGKGTVMHTMRRAMGDYGLEIPAEVLMESHNDRHPAELAVLCGARLVIGSEVDTGRKWNESRLKRLSGGDPISARFMCKDPFEFEPSHTLVLMGNSKPGLRAVDTAIRARIHLVDFAVTIEADKRDTQLSEKLAVEYGGILAWAIKGCVKWQRIGLAPPTCILEATETYLDGEDHFGLWLGENTEPEHTVKVKLGELLANYRTWCSFAGVLPLGRNSFSDRLAATDGITRYKRRQQAIVFLGVKLHDHFRRDEGDDGKRSERPPVQLRIPLDMSKEIDA